MAPSFLDPPPLSLGEMVSGVFDVDAIPCPAGAMGLRLVDGLPVLLCGFELLVGRVAIYDCRVSAVADPLTLTKEHETKGSEPVEAYGS